MALLNRGLLVGMILLANPRGAKSVLPTCFPKPLCVDPVEEVFFFAGKTMKPFEQLIRLGPVTDGEMMSLFKAIMKP